MPPTPEPLDRLVVRAAAAVTRLRRHILAGHGLSATALDVLLALDGPDGPDGPDSSGSRDRRGDRAGRAGPAQRDLAAAVGVTPATLTPVLDELERRGDLRRERDGTDRRIVRVWLTPRGAARRAAASAAVDAAVAAILPAPGPREQAARAELEGLLAAADPVAWRGCAG